MEKLQTPIMIVFITSEWKSKTHARPMYAHTHTPHIHKVGNGSTLIGRVLYSAVSTTGCQITTLLSIAYKTLFIKYLCPIIQHLNMTWIVLLVPYYPAWRTSVSSLTGIGQVGRSLGWCRHIGRFFTALHGWRGIYKVNDRTLVW